MTNVERQSDMSNDVRVLQSIDEMSNEEAAICIGLDISTSLASIADSLEKLVSAQKGEGSKCQ